MDLNEILAMWEKDSIIDENKLDKTSVDTAILHSKYLQILSITKLQHKKAEMNQKTLLKDKWLYYNGKMTKEDIEEKGWKFDPFNGLKVLKGEMNYYYDSDTDIQKSEERIQYFKIMIETLQDIVDTIRWRHQHIGNIIKWKMFEAGA